MRYDRKQAVQNGTFETKMIGGTPRMEHKATREHLRELKSLLHKAERRLQDYRKQKQEKQKPKRSAPRRSRPTYRMRSQT